jgi:hypothetical protein
MLQSPRLFKNALCGLEQALCLFIVAQEPMKVGKLALERGDPGMLPTDELDLELERLLIQRQRSFVLDRWSK